MTFVTFRIGAWEGSSAVPSELRSPLAISDLLVSNSSPESADAIQESGVDNASSQLDGKLIDVSIYYICCLFF